MPALLLTAGCPAPAFDYGHHSPPRVSVVHRPLHPGTGEPIQLVARPDVGSTGAVSQVEITWVVSGRGIESRTCGPGDLDAEGNCVATVAPAGAAGLGIYSASVTDAGGRHGRSPSSYVFQIGNPGAPEAFPLRAPFDLLEGRRSLAVLLVRDRESYASDGPALADAEGLIYDGVLEDPVYRWRDGQLGFYYSPYPGVTRDYDSGLAVRCGQDPWLGSPQQADAEADAAFADVVAVLHRKGGYRDCSGIGIVTLGAGARRNFSAHGQHPETFHHELGHALAGLSDEYTESTADRTPDAAPPRDPTISCTCCSSGSGGTEPGPDLCLPGQPRCGVDPLPPECFPATDLTCPPLASLCAHPNVFPDQASCEAAALAARGHPGVEIPVNPLDCRRLCAAGACPCEPSDSGAEVWILDRREPPFPSAPDDDVMGVLDGMSPGERHGPACARCLETTFCLVWETGRGRTQAEAESRCLSP